MPNIPLVTTPQNSLINANAVPHAGVNTNYNIQDFSSASRSVSRATYAVADFFKAKQQAADFDAVSELDLAVNDVYGQFDTFCRSNPNEYASYGDKLNEFNAILDDRINPIMEKMSAETRKQAKAGLAARRLKQQQNTEATSWQSEATVLRSNNIARIDFACKQGDFDFARQQITDGINAQLLRPDEREVFLREVDRKEDYYSITDLAKNATYAELNDLANMVQDKNQLNNLTLDDRRELGNFLNARKTENENRAFEFFKASYLDENYIPPTVDELKQKWKNGELSDQAATTYINFAEAQNRRKETEIARGNLIKSNDAFGSFRKKVEFGTAPTFDDITNDYKQGKINLDEYFQRKEYLIQYQNSVPAFDKRQQTLQIEQFKDSLNNSMPSGNPADWSNERSIMLNRAIEVSNGDVATASNLIKQVNDHFDSWRKGNNIWSVPGMEAVKKELDRSFVRNGMFNDPDEVEQIKLKNDAYRVANALYMQGKQPDEIFAYIKKMRADFAEKKFTELFDKFGNLRSLDDKPGMIVDAPKERIPESESTWTMKAALLAPAYRARWDIPTESNSNDLLKSDILSVYKHSSGRMVLKLKNGNDVFADAYSNYEDILISDGENWSVK